ncbi:hypothetical protein L0P92_31165, partial [Streptomyces muensis]|nr:hypothetical protein [Streptomyces muensis]
MSVRIRLPDPEGSRAFLLGTATHGSDESPDLPAVANNLEDLRAVLTSPLGSFAAGHCDVLLDPPDLIPFFDGLNRRAAEATDTLLIYFAGHGPHSMRDRLRELVHASPATNKIVIVDGGIARELDVESCCLLASAPADANPQAPAPPGMRNTAFTGALLGLLRHGIPAAGPLLSVGALGDELRRSAHRQGLPLPGQRSHGTAAHIALARNLAAPVTA